MDKKSNECPRCGKSYVLPSSLKTHMLSHVNDTAYRCLKCNETITSEGLLMQHLSNHICNGVVGNLNLHEKQRFVISGNNSNNNVRPKQVKVYRRRFKCTKCPLSFLQKIELKDHLVSHRDDKGPDIETSTVIQQKQHDLERTVVATISSDIPSSLEKESSISLTCTRDSHQLAVCPVCRRLFPKEDDLSVHMVSHTIERESSFLGISLGSEKLDSALSLIGEAKHFCQKKSIFESLNDNHYSEESKLESYSCGKCSAIYSSESELKKHDVSHNPGAQTQPCDTETYVIRVFSSPTNTDSVSPKEEETKGFSTLFKCLMCPMTFTLKDEIEDHLASHDLMLNSEMPEAKIQNVPEAKIQNGTGALRCLSKVYDIFFKCKDCPLIFLEKKEVEIHILRNHHNVWFKSQDDGEGSTFGSSNSVSEVSTTICNDSSISVYQPNTVAEVSTTICNDNSLSEVSTTICDDSSICVYQSHECPVCTTFFSEAAGVAQHILSFHKDVDVDASFPSKSCSTEVFAHDVVVSTFSVFEDGIIVPSVTLQQCNHENQKTGPGLEEKVHRCLACGSDFENEKKLLNHKRIHGNKKYVCLVCGKSFRANSYLRVHMSVHSDDRPHRCAKCDKRYKSIRALKLHESIHLETKSIYCTVCNASFKHKNSLRLHRLVHSEVRPFQCEFCAKAFKSSQALKGHMKIHNNKGSGKEKKQFNCSECHKTYYNEKNYKYHLKFHKGEALHKCQYCGKGFVVKTFLLQHLRIHTGERPFECPRCHKRFSFRSTLRNHMETHADVKRYVCHICGIRVAQRQTLSSHLKKHGGVKQHECSVCSKKFFLKSNYRRHMRIHNGERPYKCLLCSKSFTQNAHLNHHMVSHKGEKPYMCSQCNKCFTSKSSLKNHMIIHSADQTFTCLECGKSFRSKADRKDHLLTHKTHKFVCPECGKNFVLESSLKVHLKRKSDSITYTCQICKKIFSRRACLYQHRKSHVAETGMKDVDKNKDSKTPVKESEELESIKLTEVLDDLDSQGSMQVYIIV